ncbi:hypothetical protein AAW31_04345 [Nitrosomonas communis]|uniref:Uncharacterized protein n=1 Tax=Nitrosomonas communis TaxID=44574 RepID=A0A0F7KA73_9PROT|nr:hypothetical protein AAW31_04345 [Nitrosomonas communis]
MQYGSVRANSAATYTIRIADSAFFRAEQINWLIERAHISTRALLYHLLSSPPLQALLLSCYCL